MGGVSSGASFALKLVNEMSEGEVSGVFSEVLAIDPDKDTFDVSFRLPGEGAWLLSVVCLRALGGGWLGPCQRTQL